MRLPLTYHHRVGECENQHQNHQQEQRREEEREDKQSRNQYGWDTYPLVQTLTIEHKDKRAEHDTRACVILQDDDYQRQQDDKADVYQVAQFLNRVVVVTHQSCHRQSHSNLRKLNGLHHETAERIPRFRTVERRGESLGQNNRTRDEQHAHRIGVVGVHMVEARVHQQDAERSHHSDTSPRCLLDVKVRE